MTTMRVIKDGGGSGTEGSTTAEGLSGLLDSFQDGGNVLNHQMKLLPSSKKQS